MYTIAAIARWKQATDLPAQRRKCRIRRPWTRAASAGKSSLCCTPAGHASHRGRTCTAPTHKPTLSCEPAGAGSTTPPRPVLPYHGVGAADRCSPRSRCRTAGVFLVSKCVWIIHFTTLTEVKLKLHLPENVTKSKNIHYAIPNIPQINYNLICDTKTDKNTLFLSFFSLGVKLSSPSFRSTSRS